MLFISVLVSVRLMKEQRDRSLISTDLQIGSALAFLVLIGPSLFYLVVYCDLPSDEGKLWLYVLLGVSFVDRELKPCAQAHLAARRLKLALCSSVASQFDRIRSGSKRLVASNPRGELREA